jgi:hypothetical protein
MRLARNLLVALAVGLGLAWSAEFLMGVLAAIAIPRSFFEALRGHSTVAFLLHTTLLVQFPAAVLSFLVGILLFRLLGTSSLWLVLVCAAPWLVYVAVGSVQYYLGAQLPALVKLGFIFSWQSLPGLLAVPFGLWLAARASGPTGSNPSIERTASGGLRPPPAAAHVER